MQAAGLFNGGSERAAAEISFSMHWAVAVGPVVLAAALWVCPVEEIDKKKFKENIICWLNKLAKLVFSNLASVTILSSMRLKLFSFILCVVSAANALHFYLDANQRRCFIEELPTDTVVEGKHFPLHVLQFSLLPRSLSCS